MAAGSAVRAIDPSRLIVSGGASAPLDPRDYIADFQKIAKSLRGWRRSMFEEYIIPSTSKKSMARSEARVRRTLSIAKREFGAWEQKLAESVGELVEDRGLWPVQKYTMRRFQR